LLREVTNKETGKRHIINDNFLEGGTYSQNDDNDKGLKTQHYFARKEKN